MASKKNEIAKPTPSSLAALGGIARADEVDVEAALAEARQQQTEERTELREDLTQKRINVQTIEELTGSKQITAVILFHAQGRAFWKEAKPVPGTRPNCMSADGRLGVGDNNIDNLGQRPCHECPQSQFGSAANGKGQWCKKMRLLAIHRLDPRDEHTLPTEVVQCSPTTLPKIAGYLEKFILDNEMYFTYETIIKKVGGDTGHFEFERGAKLSDDVIGVVLGMNAKLKRDFKISVENLAASGGQGDDPGEVGTSIPRTARRID